MSGLTPGADQLHDCHPHCTDTRGVFIELTRLRRVTHKRELKDRCDISVIIIILTQTLWVKPRF